MKKFSALLLLVIVTVFIAQNFQVVEIKFFAWSLKVSRALVIFLTLFIGILLGWLLGRQKRGVR